MRALPLLALLSACTPDPEPTTPPVEEATSPTGAEALDPLDAPRLLRRISLDLLGRLPDGADLDLVRDDPAQVAVVTERYLQQPWLEDRMVDLLAEHWWTRVDVFDVVYQDYGLRPETEFQFERDVGEEPLRVLAKVIAEDRPWTDAVLVETTQATPFLAGIWPLEWVGEEPGLNQWAAARYTDGRPAAGVLSTNGLWWRYITTDSNMNRGRAAAISRLLLCEDYLARPISFTAADADVSDPETAIKTDPYCMACHASLDPVAASLFGFWWLSLYSRIEEDRYHPEREALAEEMIGESPAWYGEPMEGLGDLGWHISQDPRFYTCAVETFSQLLWRRPVGLADQPRIAALREGFLHQDARTHALLRAIIETPEYRAGGVVDGAAQSVDDRENTARMLSPYQLDRVARSLVDLEWRRNGFEQLRNDDVGYRVLAGGVDGQMLTEPQRDPGLPYALVAQRTAQAVADLAVRYELEGGGPQFVLSGVTADVRPGDPAFDAAVRDLWWRLTATELTDADAEAYGQLWLGVYDEAEDNPYQAWRSMLSLMLRDPAFLTY